jgi:hypothetical protein
MISCNVSLFINAQQVNSLYFMEDVPVRHFLNPSFQPTNDYYLSLPIIGFTQFSMGNNSLSFKDIIYNVNGKTVSFLDSLGDKKRFLATLKPTTIFQTDFQTNLLSVGFRKESAYWTFSFTEKEEGMISLPKDLFQLSLFGTQNIQNNTFNFSATQGNLSIYTEAAIGYSRKLNDKWTFGGKLKLLIGSANVSNNNNQFLVGAGINDWTINGNGTLNYSGHLKIVTASNYQSFAFIKPANLSDWLKPSGIGAGIDVGFEYRLDKNIKLSGAINDLGFINWFRNSQNYQYSINYSFKGLNPINNNSTATTIQDVYNQLILNNGLLNSIVNGFNTSSRSILTTNSYITFTKARINLGFEYSLINDKLSFGLLSYSQIFNNIMTEELTASVNGRPNKWLNASLSYSVFNGQLSTIGAGIGIKKGIFNWFMAADYLPFQKTTLSLSDLGANYPKINIPIPYNSTCFNIAAGLNLIFDRKMKNKGLHKIKSNQDCNCEWK